MDANPLASFVVDDIDDWTDAPEFTFLHNLGIVTVRDRVTTANLDGSWVVSYQNPRTARIADDGTLVYYITNQCYFSYKDTSAFCKKRDDARENLAFNEPLSFSPPL